MSAHDVTPSSALVVFYENDIVMPPAHGGRFEALFYAAVGSSQDGLLRRGRGRQADGRYDQGRNQKGTEHQTPRFAAWPRLELSHTLIQRGAISSNAHGLSGFRVSCGIFGVGNFIEEKGKDQRVKSKTQRAKRGEQAKEIRRLF
jgi:hypothetical protein